MVRRLMLAVSAALLTASAAPAVAAEENPLTWRADLSSVDGNDVNIAVEDGALTAAGAGGGEAYLVLPERTLDRAVNRVSAETTAATPRGSAVEIAVRGRQADGTWTEWVPSADGAATLPGAVTTVQVRVGLFPGADGAWPVVRDVALRAEEVPSARATLAAKPLSYEVFATREGLVGGTTANGHVITSRDHFVALPSGSALAPKNAGDYTVRVCTTDGSRCEYAPVWDVGPWNTKDDYWNPSSERQMWTDLPQGTPEAQAAYQDGYNGGRDQFGRQVANPAGIDLADGTFWDGLRLSDNSWVEVTYLWTGSGTTGVVSTAGDPLNVRASASTSAAIKGLAANHAEVTLECHVRGDTVTGPLGTSDIWNRIGPGHYVSDTYLQTGSDEPVVPECA